MQLFVSFSKQNLLIFVLYLKWLFHNQVRLACESISALQLVFSITFLWIFDNYILINQLK